MKIRFVVKQDIDMIHCKNSWFNSDNKELTEFEVEDVTEISVEGVE